MGLIRLHVVAVYKHTNAFIKVVGYDIFLTGAVGYTHKGFFKSIG
jgi:hypothetical protein